MEFQRVVAVQPAERRSSAASAIVMTVAICALVAVATRTGFASQDSLLQTAMPMPAMAQMNMALQQPVMYAQAVPVKGVSRMTAVQAKPISTILQDAPADAPPADAPPADAAAAPGAAAEGAVAGDLAAAVGVAAGAGPGAALGAPAATICAAPCPNPACVDNNAMGCYASHGVPPAVTWVCECPAPPPPPVVGSAAWLASDDQKIEDPGAENAAAGANLAMYQTGSIAVNLNRYLQASADKAKTQAEIEGLIYRDLAAVSKANGVVEPAAAAATPAAPGAEPAADAGFPHNVFGIKTGI